MTVRLFAHLIDLAGMSAFDQDNPANVRELINQLCARFGKEMARQLLNAQGEPIHDDVYVLVNGRHIRQLQGLDTSLSATDQVSIIPVMEAG